MMWPYLSWSFKMLSLVALALFTSGLSNKYFHTHFVFVPPLPLSGIACVIFGIIGQALTYKAYKFTLQSRAVIPLSIKDLSLVIPAIRQSPGPTIRDYVDEYKWYCFVYTDTPSPLRISLLATSDTEPIRTIRVDLEYASGWNGKLLPVCVEQIATMVDAIVEITAGEPTELREWLSNTHRDDQKKAKVGILNLKICEASPESLEGSELQKVLEIYCVSK